MKDWSDKSLCFECARKVGANINIGLSTKGRCQRCHSEQTLFRVAQALVVVPCGEADVCPECAHPGGAHASSCGRSEIALLQRERDAVIRVLEETVGFDPQQPLAQQIRRALIKDPGNDS